MQLEDRTTAITGTRIFSGIVRPGRSSSIRHVVEEAFQCGFQSRALVKIRWRAGVHTGERLVDMLTPTSFVVVAALYLGVVVQALPQAAESAAARDLCAKVGGQKWVAPSDLRACFTSVRVNQTVKANILEVIGKTLGFHTSTNYQIRAPAPFTSDVNVNIPQELERIKRQSYSSEYDFHVDLSRTLKRLNDGHTVWTFGCYDSLFLNFVPAPLALITAADGRQHVHIAPEAFNVSTAEFPDQIDVWQNALPGALKGKLASLSGARVLLINGRDPWDAVNANTLITGSYQSFGTRQRGFFSSYQRGPSSWNYILGNFAQQSLPLSDSAILTIQRTDSRLPETIVLPYRSRINPTTKTFTDTASWRANNCVAQPGTNGVDRNADSGAPGLAAAEDPTARFRQQPPLRPELEIKHPMNVILDTAPPSNVGLPEQLQPSLPSLDGSRTVSQFYLLKDGVTGVLALGSFSDDDYNAFFGSMLKGLLTLKSLGAKQLIVDVSNNGGGYVCAAHWLHRIIAGPKDTTEPQAGLYTEARAGNLAQLIVDELVKNPDLDANQNSFYNPISWRDANNVEYNKTTNWLRPVVKKTINRQADAFSPRLGQECQPEGFPYIAPAEAIFDPKRVVIVSNGRCASSCSLFSITMVKHEGAKTVVLGGKTGVNQQYCGTVGGQSSNFKTMDSDVKTVKLKGNALAPPDLLVNGGQGIVWRLGFGIADREEPEEWQDHTADLNLPITADLVNDPVAIWETVTAKLLS